MIELDRMFGLDALGLYFEAHIAGIEGENFFYSVYYDDALTDEKFEETQNAVIKFVESFGEDTYLGYIDITNEGDKTSIYLDIGNTTPEMEDIAVKGMIKALNNVTGIRSVIINEDCEGDFDF